MRVLDLLSEQEKNDFISYIQEFGIGSNCDEYELRDPFSNMASADYLLRFWDMNKSAYLGNLFKDSLIRRFPIEYTTPIQSIDFDELFYHNSFSDALMNRAYNGYPDYRLFFDNSYPSRDSSYVFEYFNDECMNGESDLYKCVYLIQMFRSTQNAYDNIYNGPTFEIQIGNQPRLKVVHGAKYSKMVGKIADYLGINKELYEDWRQIHSRLINTKTLHGNLCLSIHPMDYLTMSDASFTSCMSWMQRGGYRRGTVEMMNSEKVVVAYLESEHDELAWEHDDGRHTWNYKKWRILLIAEPNFVATVKGYPYRCDELSLKALECLRSLYAEANWDPHVYSFDEDWVDIGPEENSKRIAFNSSGAMYCDMGATTHFITIIANSMDKNYYCDYSGESECMFCGCIDDYFADECCVFCDRCMSAYDADDYGICDACGRRVFNDDAIWLEDGICYCPDCAHDYLSYCKFCNTYTDKSSARPIIISYKGINTVAKLNDDALDELNESEFNRTETCLCSQCLSRVKRVKNGDTNRWCNEDMIVRYFGVDSSHIFILPDANTDENDSEEYDYGMMITANNINEFEDIMYNVADKNYDFAPYMAMQNEILVRHDHYVTPYTKEEIAKILITE